MAWLCDCHVMVLLKVWGYYIIDPVTWSCDCHVMVGKDYKHIHVQVKKITIMCLRIFFTIIQPEFIILDLYTEHI